MAVTIYYDQDADLNLLKGKKVAVIGYGSQGHAHSLNLKDNGVDVVVGLYRGSPSAERARQAGLYRQAIEPNLKPGKTLMFAHGFSVHFGQIVAPAEVDVSMVAPKGPGHVVRDLFTQGVGTPALVCVHQDASGRALPNALAYAKGIGGAKGGGIQTTLRHQA